MNSPLRLPQLCVTASLALGFGLGAATTARAAGLTGATLSGDNYRYCATGSSTYRGSTCTDSLDTILSGNATSPGGNVELGARTETQGFSSQGSLSGSVGGQAITLSSLTAADWNSDLDGNGQTLGADWMRDLLTTYSPKALDTPDKGFSLIQFLLDLFTDSKGRERFSDPNVAYVNQEDGQVKVGLTGHYDARPLLASAGITPPVPLGVPIQVSEIVKVTYGGDTFFKYGLGATASGLVNNLGAGADGISHSGNYEVSFAAVPEPSLLLGGLVALGLGTALKRKAEAV
ncbi:NF038130 family PEP-CTERM protein [Prochlorothrix hollandica]|uniref:PEP-CTERM protein-sorting domain-containing protein n=1 Tax=Prochlorothrix hollandica PCC 9006 = CALU 1027 TaxID=317619 RepID=A0A0M2PTA9_PROHO|nr:NF038130 family PEP-CTERM protein [Prochlorothrix hollandica]KKI99770.1 hypothetical protein PROH_07835 [Prochlorothrix hollandica PCC 9006 = CALU 1027]